MKEKNTCTCDSKVLNSKHCNKIKKMIILTIYLLHKATARKQTIIIKNFVLTEKFE